MVLKELNKKYTSEVDNVFEEEWSNILQKFDDATIYQSWSYGKVRWGQDNLSHLVLKKNNEIVSIAQLRIIKLPFSILGIAYLTWGPVYKKKGHKINIENIQQMLRAIYNEYVISRGLYIKIRSNIIQKNGNEIESIFLEEGYTQNYYKSSYRTFVVDLTPELDDIKGRFKKKWRGYLNRAQKKGLTIKMSTDTNLFNIFIVLYKDMQSKKKFDSGVDIIEFKKIQDDLHSSLKMNIFVCEFEGEVISIEICSAIGNTGIGILSATNTLGRKLGASYLMQWEEIKWLKSLGFQWDDLGGINPKKNPGVYHFKAGLSGKEIRHISDFDGCKKKYMTKLMKYAELSARILNKIRTLLSLSNSN